MSQAAEPVRPSLRSQSAWLLLAKIIGFACSFVLPLIVVRVLTQEQFGVYRQSFIVVTNAVTSLPIGLAMSAYYYLARDPARRGSAIFNILSFHFVVGGLAFAFLWFYPQSLGTIFNSPEMTRLAPLIGATIWLWLFSVFLETVAVANREPRIATVFIVFAQLSKTVLMSTFVLYFSSVDSILYAAMVQAIIQLGMLFVYLARRFPRFWTTFDPAFFRAHMAYAIPFGIAGILWTAQVDIHYYFVSYRFGDAALAVYAVGCFQLPLVTMLSASVTSVLIPRMSELQATSDTREMIRLTARAMQKLSLAYLPLYVFLMITSETLITTLFTQRYASSVPIFRIFLTLLPFSILISDPIVRAYESLGAFLLKVRVVTFVILIAGLYYGIHNLGLPGIIAIVIGVRILEKLFVEFVIFRRIGVTLADAPLLKDVGKIGALSLVIGLFTAAAHHLLQVPVSAGVTRAVAFVLPSLGPQVLDFVAGCAVLGVSGGLFGALFLASCWAAGLLEEDEIALILRMTGIARLRRGR